MQITQYFSRERLLVWRFMNVVFEQKINLGVLLSIFFQTFLKSRLCSRYKRAMCSKPKINFSPFINNKLKMEIATVSFLEMNTTIIRESGFFVKKI